MKTPKDLLKDQQNLVNSTTPPKSFFTIESCRRENYYDYSCPFHYHEWYEIYYLKKGSCVYHIDNRSFLVNQGDWIFIPAMLPHKVLYRTSPHERYLIYATKDYLPAVILPHINEFIATPIYTPPRAENVEPVEDLAHKMFYEFQNPTEFSTSLIKCYLLELLVLFLNRSTPMHPVCESNENDIVIANLLDYINLHYGNNITLELLSDICELSPNYLSRKFKMTVGMPLMEYLRTIRLQHAKSLLLETEQSIAQIAYQCGFNDSNYFSYIFKQSEHLSPLQYRKLHS